MVRLSIADPMVRAKLVRTSDDLMIAVAVSLPWSTSATSILLVLWLLALFPTLEWSDLRRELMTLAGGLPVLLFLLGVLGMTWADVTLLERWNGLTGFFKLLVILLLMVQFRRSDNGMRVFIGFLIACVALLIASWIVTIWPDVPKGSRDPGVAVKGYIIQSAEFTVCATGLLYVAVEAAREGRWTMLTALVALALAFLHDIFFIATSRTTLVVIPVLILIYGVRQFGWKGFLDATAAGVVIAAALWATSPYLRDRAMSVFLQTEKFKYENSLSSVGQRFVYWTKSLRIIESAPLAGHGTGSITEMFRNAAMGPFRNLGGSTKQSPQSDFCCRHPARTTWHHDALGDVGVPFSSIPRCRIGGVARASRRCTECRRFAVQLLLVRFHGGVALRRRRRRGRGDGSSAV
jgi:O-antigen ligase